MSNKRKAARATEAAQSSSTELALPTITRSQSVQILKTRATELYHEARAAQQAGIVRFESEYGRADRIDASLLADLQRLQMRFAGIAARQHRHGYAQEPKVNKFVDSLGDVIGKVTVHLATENALELFAPINEQDYTGYAGRVGTKGYDEGALAGYRIVDDPSGPVAASPSSEGDDADSLCLHESVEPLEDDATRGVSDECGGEFDLNAPARRTSKTPRENPRGGSRESVGRRLLATARSCRRGALRHLRRRWSRSMPARRKLAGAEIDARSSRMRCRT